MIGLVVAVGFVLGRLNVLGSGSQEVISRLVFSAGTPALLFVTLASTDLTAVFSPVLIIAALSTIAVALIYAGVAALIWKRPTGTTVIGALSACYVNAGNLGIPISVFVLGDAAFVAPVMLFQVVVLAPIAYAILDLDGRSDYEPWWSRISRPLRNPILIGSALGMLVSASGVSLPEIVLEPVGLVAGIAVPGALIAFGLSLSGGLLTSAPVLLRDLLLINFLKLVLHPVLAFLLGFYLFGLSGIMLLAVTLFAALPTAQNVLIAAIRYNRGPGLARQAILTTMVLSVLPLVAIGAFIG